MAAVAAHCGRGVRVAFRQQLVVKLRDRPRMPPPDYSTNSRIVASPGHNFSQKEVKPGGLWAGM